VARIGAAAGLGAAGAKGGALLGKNGLEQTGAVVGEVVAQGGTEAAINAGTAAGTAAGEMAFQAVDAMKNGEFAPQPPINEEDF